MNTIGSDVRERIDEHLDAIDRILAAQGTSRAERRNVTDDVETQILDMLAARVTGSPALADIDAVLAELDAPEAFGDAHNTNNQSHAKQSTVLPKSDWHRNGTLSVALALAAIVLLALGLAIGAGSLVCGCGAFAIAAIVCGLFAIGTFRGKLGTALGAVLALVCVLMYS
jgi:hypothetical protein